MLFKKLNSYLNFPYFFYFKIHILSQFLCYLKISIFVCMLVVILWDSFALVWLGLELNM